MARKIFAAAQTTPPLHQTHYLSGPYQVSFGLGSLLLVTFTRPEASNGAIAGSARTRDRQSEVAGDSRNQAAMTRRGSIKAGGGNKED